MKPPTYTFQVAYNKGGEWEECGFKKTTMEAAFELAKALNRFDKGQYRVTRINWDRIPRWNGFR